MAKLPLHARHVEQAMAEFRKTFNLPEGKTLAQLGPLSTDFVLSRADELQEQANDSKH